MTSSNTFNAPSIQTGLALRGGADGSFGAATQTVLTTFQKTNGTPQTGVVGEQDASILGLTASGATGAARDLERLRLPGVR